VVRAVRRDVERLLLLLRAPVVVKVPRARARGVEVRARRGRRDESRRGRSARVPVLLVVVVLVVVLLLLVAVVRVARPLVRPIRRRVVVMVRGAAARVRFDARAGAVGVRGAWWWWRRRVLFHARVVGVLFIDSRSARVSMVS
jgi:hypothetical protein